MNDQTVATFYDVYNAFFPTSQITDLTEGIYENSETTYEEAQANQTAWLLDQISCAHGSIILDIGSGYGPLLKTAQKRGAKTTGISLSKKQVDFCLNIGLDVFLLNYKDIQEEWHDKFDGIVANGSLEHFVKPQEAHQSDEIYANFFKICHQLIKPESSSRRLATTAIHFGQYYPDDPLDLIRNPFDFPFLSVDFHAAVVQRAMACFVPVAGQLKSCAKPFFKLVREVDGTEDYRKTSEEWLKRVRKSCINPVKIPGIVSRLVPFLIQHPIHTITSLSFILTESWNEMFRGPNPPMKLFRHVWEYQE